MHIHGLALNEEGDTIHAAGHGYIAVFEHERITPFSPATPSALRGLRPSR